MNSFDTGMILAILYGMTFREPKVGLSTGFSAVSATHAAGVDSPSVSNTSPLPGTLMRLASCMIADCLVASVQISLDWDG